MTRRRPDVVSGHEGAQAVGKQPSLRGRWLGYAAAVWAFSFAAVSFYWAAAGRADWRRSAPRSGIWRSPATRSRLPSAGGAPG